MDDDDKFTGSVGVRNQRTPADVELLRLRFQSFDPAEKYDRLNGSITWTSTDRKRRIDIDLLHWPENGISLVWMSKGLDIDYPEHHTVHDASKLKREHWIDTGGQEWALIGTFLPVKKAWWVIEDFFANPTVLSPRVEWIETRKLPRFPL